MGLIIHTNIPVPIKPTTGRKWDKFKRGLHYILDAVVEGFKFIETVRIRKTAGLGVNLTKIYTYGRCFLKGFFNSAEAWRNNGNIDGWRMAEQMRTYTN